MTNRMKGIMGIACFVLTSVEQGLSSYFGRFFEQPIDPIFLLGIVGLVYGIQKFKLPDTEVADVSKLVKYMVGSLILAIVSIACAKLGAYLVFSQAMSFSMTGLIATIKSISSFGWCLSTIGALLSLRDVFLMK